MKLILDETQRLNLNIVIGSQRGTVDDVRLFWRLLDRFELTEEERKKINFRTQEINGQQVALWDLVFSNPVEYELARDEYDRLARVVKEWQPGFLTAQDRRWLEPLLAQFDSNGQPKQ
jgi:hypothetical protein